LTFRLDVGFLPGPTKKECVFPKADRKRTQHRNLASREKSLGDLLYVQAVADKFEIDADLAAASNRIKRHTVRMGYVEMDRITIRFLGQGRLPVGTVAEGHGLGSSVQVKAENLSEHTASDDKAFAIYRKVKLSSPRLFIFSKRV